MLNSGDLEFSFSGLKTAVLTLVRKEGLDRKADIAAGFQAAVVDVLAGKCVAALKHTGLTRLVVAGGVGANRALRERLDAEAAQRHFTVFYPPLELCTDNGAMIAFAGGMRLTRGQAPADGRFGVRPRWELSELSRPA
jgi:N6-L-threonylcarbamoyladenine synthase